MPITVECGDCGTKYAADERSAGRRVKCRNCGNVFTAQPANPAAVPAVADAKPARPVRTVRPAPPPPPPEQRPLDEPADFDAIMALASGASDEPAGAYLSPPPPPPPPMRLPAYASPPSGPVPAFHATAPVFVPQPSRRKRDTGAVGLDNATPWLLILYVGPFSPAALVSRLGDEPQEASVLLRRQGTSAEPALAEALKNPEPRVAEGAAALLSGLATQRSLPALREAAASNDQRVRESARAALRRLAPKEFDAVAEALLDVQSESPFVKPKALQALADAKPDARRPKIATLLEDMLVSEKAGFESAAIGKALATWYGENTVNRLLPLLNKRTFGPQRQAIMQVLGATKDKRVALPLMDPWLLEDSDAAVSALIELGQPAEDELVKQKAMWHPPL